jgi:hypothetical protein
MYLFFSNEYGYDGNGKQHDSHSNTEQRANPDRSQYPPPRPVDLLSQLQDDKRYRQKTNKPDSTALLRLHALPFCLVPPTGFEPAPCRVKAGYARPLTPQRYIILSHRIHPAFSGRLLPDLAAESVYCAADPILPAVRGCHAQSA